MSQPKIKDKHIELLTRSKASGIKIGSRSVPHRLKQFERKKYELARKTGYLNISTKYRQNVWNIWKKYCQAIDQPCYVLLKNIEHKTAEVWQGDEIIFAGTAEEAKKNLTSLINDLQR